MSDGMTDCEEMYQDDPEPRMMPADPVAEEQNVAKLRAAIYPDRAISIREHMAEWEEKEQRIVNAKTGGELPEYSLNGHPYAEGTMRNFETGATRDSEEGKFDYEGFLSPLALEAYGAYMNGHRKQTDGGLRASDNWQKGMSRDVYIKSAWRHLITLWKLHRGIACFDERDGHEVTKVEAACGLLFNTFGYIHEQLKEQREEV